MARSMGLYLPAVSATESGVIQVRSWAALSVELPLAIDWCFSRRAWVPLLATMVGCAILGSAPAAMATLQRGDHSTAVVTLQTQLQQLGFFAGPITGYYGSLTQDAVLRLQQQNRLSADGVVGPNTQALLDRLKTARSTPAPAGQLGQDAGLLQRGSSGEAVVKLQQQLTSFGYPLPSTGYFGAMTEAAVVQFQRDRQLKPDALVGTLTAAALASPPAASPPVVGSPVVSSPVAGSPVFGSLRQGSRGAAVVALQERLAKLGYFTATATGYFGPITQTAVLNFQRDYRLQVDGVVGSNTLNAMGLGENRVSAAW
jgi:peptidoglycan hydrolase-like protein with peptidoglycan-binding domain